MTGKSNKRTRHMMSFSDDEFFEEIQREAEKRGTSQEQVIKDLVKYNREDPYAKLMDLHDEMREEYSRRQILQPGVESASDKLFEIIWTYYANLVRGSFDERAVIKVLWDNINVVKSEDIDDHKGE